MTKLLTMTAILFAFLFSSSLALAWSGHQGGKGSYQGQRDCCQMKTEYHAEKSGDRLERMAVVLDLSAEQQEQLEGLQQQRQESRREMREKIRASRQELQQFRHSENFDLAEFRARAEKHAALKAEMMVQRANRQQQFQAMLTPAQRDKAEQLRTLQLKGRCGGFGLNDCAGPRQDPGQGRGQGNRYHNCNKS